MNNMSDLLVLSEKKQELLKKLLSSNAPNTNATQRKYVATQRILPCEKRHCYPATYAQNRIYFLHQIAQNTLNYNLPFATLIEGELSFERFNHAIIRLSERHEALRTSFRMVDDVLVQIIDENIHLDIAFHEANECDFKTIFKDFAQKFDLSKAPLLHVNLIKFSENRHLFVLDMHHIISDGTSLNILIRDFFNLYYCKENPNLVIQYKDYAVWEKEWFVSEIAAKQLAFWKKQFEQYDGSKLTLPTDYARPMVQSYRGDTFTFKLTQETTLKLKGIAARTHTTLFVVLLSIYKIFLHKYSNQEDIVTGVPIAGRIDPAVQNIVGLFVNTLAIRAQISNKETFSTFLIYMHEKVSSCLDNQLYPFEKILEHLNLKRDISRNPMFDTMFAMQNMQRSSIVSKDLSFKPYPFDYKIANFDLEFYANEYNENIEFKIEYCSDLFKKDTIKQFALAFQNIAEKVSDNPRMKLSEIEGLSKDEAMKIVDKLTGLSHSLESSSFQNIFENICEQFPNKIAAIFNEHEITYDQLNQAANRLAHRLIEIGVRLEDFVCVLMDRSIDFLICMLAILKSGAVYIPIDPVLPPDRIQLIIDSAKNSIILTEKRYLGLVQVFNNKDKVFLSQKLLDKATETRNPPVIYHPKNLAYVIFTSGSTGVPKGAMVEHLGMLNHLYAKVIDMALMQNDVVAQNATQSFDVSVWQFLVALIVGGAVVVFDKNHAWEPQKLIQEIQKRNVTIFETVPSHMLIILDYLEQLSLLPDISSLRWLIVNGEPLTSDICQRWFKLYRQIPLLNAYGPTECSDDVTHHKIYEYMPQIFHTLPIGKTIINHSLYILDDNLQFVPPGVIGELYISGSGVGRGYLNNPSKTAVTYLPDILSQDPGARMYKTGDQVRYIQETGDIIFLGRKDNQIKIRGHRIEIQEIEKAILSFPLCKKCLVTVYKDNDETQSLCAYVVLLEITAKEDLKNHLKNLLPHYMLPTYIEIIEQFPLLINGKIDRKKLPLPILDLGANKAGFVAPSSPLEIALQKLWANVLNIPESTIGLGQNFFELGGTSLKAIKLISRIQLNLGFHISFIDIFKYPTILEMVNYKLKMDAEGYMNLHRYPSRTLYPATSEHFQLYRDNKRYSEQTVYNMPYELKIMGDFDIHKAQKSLETLVNRHDVLRMGFVEIDNNLFLKEYPDQTIAIESVTATEVELDIIRRNFIQPFKLELPPLIRLLVVNIGKNQNVLLLDCHAVVADLISRQILVRDFFDIYFDKNLPQQTVDYKDYLIWKNDMVNGEIASEHKDFWQSTLANKVDRLISPEAQKLKKNSPIIAERAMTYWNESQLDNMDALARRLGLTSHILCFSFFAIMLAKYMNRNQFCIISPVAERDNHNLENLVGLLVNTFPIVVLIKDPRVDFLKFVHDLKHQILDAYSHQHGAAMEIYQQSSMEKTVMEETTFDATFVWGETQGKSFSDMSAKIKEKSIEDLPPRFDLRLEAFLSNNQLRLMLESRATLFSAHALEKMLKNIELVFQQVQANSFIPISEITLL